MKTKDGGKMAAFFKVFLKKMLKGKQKTKKPININYTILIGFYGQGIRLYCQIESKFTN